MRVGNDLAALGGAVLLGRRLADARPLAAVLAGAGVAVAGTGALPLTSVDAGAVHVAARLLVRTRADRAREDEARCGSGDHESQGLVHLALLCTCGAKPLAP